MNPEYGEYKDNPVVDLAEVYDRFAPAFPYVGGFVVFTFFALVALFGG